MSPNNMLPVFYISILCQSVLSDILLEIMTIIYAGDGMPMFCNLIYLRGQWKEDILNKHINAMLHLEKNNL